MKVVVKFNHFKISSFENGFLLKNFDWIKMGISIEK